MTASAVSWPSHLPLTMEELPRELRNDDIMSAAIRAKDWEATPLGDIRQWPHRLVQVVGTILHLQIPCVVVWDPGSMVTLYNEAYVQCLGIKHPSALGQSFRAVWGDLWPSKLDPILARAFGGEAVHLVDSMFAIYHDDFVEEGYCTFTSSCIFDDAGNIAGVIFVGMDSAERIFMDRQLNTIKELSTQTLGTLSTRDISKKITQVVDINPYDIPFLQLYIYNTRTHMLELVGENACTGCSAIVTPKTIPVGSTVDQPPFVPGRRSPLDLDPRTVFWQNLARDAHIDRAVCLLTVPDTVLLCGGPFGAVIRRIVVYPFEGDGFGGVIIMGINPARIFSNRYKFFCASLVEHISQAFVGVRSYECECDRTKRFEELSAAKSTFVENIAHELRTPLTLMLGPLEELLADDNQRTTASVVDTRQRDYVKLAYQNATRLFKLVNSLLDFSIVEAGRLRSFFRACPLGTITSQFASAFHEAAESAGLTFTVDIDPAVDNLLNRDDDDDKWYPFVDHDHWEKIVSNLLSNAIKYTSTGSIRLQLRVVDEQPQAEEQQQQSWPPHVELVVTDTGAGINSTDLGHIFERFYHVPIRVGISTTTGTGIGLALTLELVKAHGGTIDVTSKPLHGSTFTVRIPLGKAHLPPDQVVSTTPIQRRASPTTTCCSRHYHHASRHSPSSTMSEIDLCANINPSMRRTTTTSGVGSVDEVVVDTESAAEPMDGTVLVVDSSDDMRQFVASLLQQHRLHVLTARNGAEALRHLECSSVDLIITDIVMPEMCGLELLRHVREQWKWRLIPVILLTARCERDFQVQGIEAGADDYIIKPFSTKVLLAHVQSQLQAGRFRIELDRLVEQRAADLAASEYRYRCVVESLPAGILQLEIGNNLGRKIVFYNERFVEYTGCKDDTWIAGIGHRDIETFLHLLRDAKVTRKKFQLEFQYHRAVDGKTIWLLGQYSFLNDTTLIAVYTDVTDIKRLENERLQAISLAEMVQRDRAEEAEEMRLAMETFVDTVCHEVRNPLNGMLNNLEFIRENEDKRQRLLLRHELSALPSLARDSHDLLATIQLCVEHLHRVTNDVLDLSKIQTGGFVDKESFQPRLLVLKTVDIFRREAETKDIDITVQAHGCPESILFGQAHRIEQVMINLLGFFVQKEQHSGRSCASTTTSATSTPSTTSTTTSARPTSLNPQAPHTIAVSVQISSEPMQSLGSLSDSTSSTTERSRSVFSSQHSSRRSSTISVQSHPTSTSSSSSSSASSRRLSRVDPISVAPVATASVGSVGMSQPRSTTSTPSTVQSAGALPGSFNDTPSTFYSISSGLPLLPWQIGARLNPPSSQSDSSTCTTWTEPMTPPGDAVWLYVSLRDVSLVLPTDMQAQLRDCIRTSSFRSQKRYNDVGLGLVISSVIINRIGGQMCVHATPEEGTEFTFAVPCYRMASSIATSESVDQALVEEAELTSSSSSTVPALFRTGELSSFHILVVDDNDINQKVITRQLRNIPEIICNTETANNGQEAVEMAQREHFDLIFMDVEMPLMDGLEATRRIRTFSRQSRGTSSRVPIVGVSGNARQAQIDVALSAGMSDYIVKPFRKETLRQKVYHLLDLDRSHVL